ALGVEADLALKEETRGPTDTQGVHLLDRVLTPAALAIRHHRRGPTRATIVVELRLDAEPEEQHLHLLQQFERAGIQRDVLALVAVVRDRAVRGEQPAQEGRERRAIELIHGGREALAFAALIEDGVLLEDLDNRF